MELPRKAATGFCAMFSWCFQPHQSHNFSGTDQRRRPARSSGDGVGMLSGYQSPPAWVEDEHVEACPLCSSPFDLFTRKHHCRACGHVFCGACAAQSDRVIKYGLLEPVRLCTACAVRAKRENPFYETHLPLMEAGDVFNKHGLLRKRFVELKFIRANNLFQYQTVDVQQRQFQGEIKAIALDSITFVREAPLDKDNADLGILIISGDEVNRFDAATPAKRTQWMTAIQSALDVRNAVLAQEREERAKQVERENQEIKQMTQQLQMMDERKASFQEDRLRKRAERRESLRAKYNLPSSTSTTTAAS